MRPADNIKKLIKKLHVRTSAQLDEKIYDEISRAVVETENKKSADIQADVWKIITKNKIVKVAAVLIVLSAICLLILSDRGELEQHKTTGSKVTVISKTPSELVSAITLNMAFRDGGMQAMEKQFDKAERKVKPGLKERITIDQLICELEGC